MPEVASQMVRPCRSAAIQSAFGTRARRCGSVPGKDDIAREVDLAKIGQLTVSGLHDAHVAELQLLDDIDHPILAEGLPGQDVHTARTEQRPQRHLHRAGIRARNDGHEIIVGQF